MKVVYDEISRECEAEADRILKAWESAGIFASTARCCSTGRLLVLLPVRRDHLEEDLRVAIALAERR